MDEVYDSFRSSFGGWLRGTAAGLGTILLGIAGIALTIAAAGDWGAWPLVLTGVAVLILLGNGRKSWGRNMRSRRSG